MPPKPKMPKQNAAQEAVDLADLAIEAQGWTATKNGGFWCAIGRKISSSSEVILKLSKFSGLFFLVWGGVATKFFDIHQQDIILQYMGWMG